MRRLRFLVVLGLVAISGGCAEQGASVESPGNPVDSLTYSIQGEAPIISPWLPFSQGESDRITFRLTTGTTRVDDHMVQQDIRRITIVGEDGGEQGELSVSRDLTGIIQAKVTRAIAEDVGNLILVRNRSEPWCFFGSAFFGSHLEVGQRHTLAHYSGSAIEFVVDGRATIDGREAFIVRELTTAAIPYQLWIDPTIPCPLKGQGRLGLNDIGPKAQRFSFELEHAPPNVTVLPPGGSAGVPAVALASRRVVSHGLPPDGEAFRERFPLQHAFDHARQSDSGFKTYLAENPDAVLVSAEYVEMRPDVRTYRIWAMDFLAEEGAGYHLSVHRESVSGTTGPPLTRIVESAPRGPNGRAVYAPVLPPGSDALTLSSAFAAGSWLAGSADGIRLSYQVLGDAEAFIFVHAPSSTDVDCTLLSCTGKETSMTLAFEVRPGTLASFAGPEEAWERANV